MPTPTEKREAFRTQMTSGEMIISPGCYDPLTARLAEEAGFRCVSLGGMSTGAHLGVPEPLLTMSDQVAVASRIAKMIDIPLSVDAHNGWGDAVHAIRTVREFEHAGVATISIEDQIYPKRASYFRNIIHVLPRHEFVTKMRHIVAARQDPSLVIIGRTDAMEAVGGSKEEAVARGKLLLHEGVDMLFFRGSREITDLEFFAKEFPDTPKKTTAYGNIPASVFRDLGYTLVGYPSSAVLAAYAATRRLFDEIKAEGDIPSMTGPTYWDTRKALYRTLGLPEMWKVERETVEDVAEPEVAIPTTHMTDRA